MMIIIHHCHKSFVPRYTRGAKPNYGVLEHPCSNVKSPVTTSERLASMVMVSAVQLGPAGRQRYAVDCWPRSTEHYETSACCNERSASVTGVCHVSSTWTSYAQRWRRSSSYETLATSERAPDVHALWKYKSVSNRRWACRSGSLCARIGYWHARWCSCWLLFWNVNACGNYCDEWTLHKNRIYRLIRWKYGATEDCRECRKLSTRYYNNECRERTSVGKVRFLKLSSYEHYNKKMQLSGKRYTTRLYVGK